MGYNIFKLRIINHVQIMQISSFGLMVALSSVSYMIWLLYNYKKQLDIQNIKLLNAYLDKKLFARLINIARKSIPDRLDEAIVIIKNYYNISNIAVYSHNQQNYIYSPKQHNIAIEEYINQNYQKICQSVENGEIFTSYVNIFDTPWHITLAKLEEANDSLIALIFKDSSPRQEMLYVLDLIREMFLLLYYGERKHLTD